MPRRYEAMPNYDWDDNEFPIAYFITFRTHGTWLHGDERGSVDRHGRNLYGQNFISLDPHFSVKMERNMTSAPFTLNAPQRGRVESAIRNVCEVRKYNLFAINVRTNHAHVVAFASAPPRTVMNAFKANATRELREGNLVDTQAKICARGGSTRYLWKPQHLEAAVEYTVNGQGGPLPEF